MKRATVTIAAAAAAIGLLTGPAQSTVIPAQGATGDVHGEIRCPAGYVVVGFVGREGSWIDKIAPMCAQVLRGYVTGGVVVPDGKGGNGGERTDRYCPRDAAVRDIALTYYYEGYDKGAPVIGQHYVRIATVSGVDFSCVQMKDGASAGRAMYGPATPGENSSQRPTVLACPNQEYATGITIHYGKHVNALGLICGNVEIYTPPPPPAPPPAAPPAHHMGTGRCKPGFVWREARPGDHICVTPQSRALVASENQQADSRRDPNGAYGPMTCLSGYVWRDAMPGDTVCVTPYRRGIVQAENAQDADRKE